MPVIRTISSGNIIHKPIIKKMAFSSFFNYTAPGLVGQQNPEIVISCGSIGPDRTLYVGIYTTRGSAGAGFQAPLFNGRVMTQGATAGAGPTKPVLWYYINLLNNETNGTFRWREDSAVVIHMGLAVWVMRGMRSQVPYSSAGNTASGSSTGGFIFQRNTLSLSHPPNNELSYVLFLSVKGRADSGDSTSFAGHNLGSSLAQNTIISNSANSVTYWHGFVSLTNTGSTPFTTNWYAEYNSNSLPISMAAAVVLY